MEYVDVSGFNHNYIDVWKNNQSLLPELTNLSPLLYDQLKKNVDLLFLGLNPSFNPETLAKILEKKPEIKGKIFNLNNSIINAYLQKNEFNEVITQLHTFSNYIISTEKINEILNDLYTIANEENAIINYFKPFYEIKTKLEEHYGLSVDFDTIDLFVVRNTRQKELETIIKNTNENDASYTFFLNQLTITQNLIKTLHPKIILVNNAFGSHFIKKYWNTNISEFDKEKGIYYFLMNKELKIPIFFSGMLSGQRALDIYSFERLIWHIAKILTKNFS